MDRPAPITLLLMLLAGCGGEAVVHRPTTPRPIPDSEAIRRAAIDELGQRAFDAMSAGDPTQLLYEDRDLDVLLADGALVRIAARRLALPARLDVDPSRPSQPLASATYAGVCLQGARAEEAGGPLGLAATAWVFDRLLVIGRRPTGQRVAAWLEGLFVFSDVGFAALDLERVEEPRWEHSDLEIAPCDLSVRNDLPEIAR